MPLFTATNIKFRNLQYVLAVAETRSFTLAAQSCHVTQSTLSSGVRDLEEILGRALFDRSHRQISLTAFGEKVLPDIREIVKKSDNLLTRSRKFGGKYSGPVRFGVIPTIAPYLLPGILQNLHAHYPEIDLMVNENMSHILIEQVRSGALDMALLAFPYATGGLESKILYEESFYLLRPRQNKDVTFLESDEIQAEHLLLLEDGHCLRDHALAVCAGQDEATRQAFRATSLPTLVQLVRHGYGTTLLPEMAARTLDIPEDLEALPVTGQSARRGIGIVWRKNSPMEETIEQIGGEIQKLEKSSYLS